MRSGNRSIKILTALCVSGVFCISFATGYAADIRQVSPTRKTTTLKTLQSTPLAAAPSVQTVTPDNPSLILGGKPVIVTLSGTNLNLITSVQVMSNDEVVPDVTAELGDPVSTSRQVTLTAQTGAPAGEYKVRFLVGSQAIDLSASVISVVVSGPPVQTPASGVTAGKIVRGTSPVRDMEPGVDLAKRSSDVTGKLAGTLPDSKPSGTIMIDTVPLPERPASGLPASRIPASSKVDTLKIDTVPLPEKSPSGPTGAKIQTRATQELEKAQMQPLKAPVPPSNTSGAKGFATEQFNPEIKYVERKEGLITKPGISTTPSPMQEPSSRIKRIDRAQLVESKQFTPSITIRPGHGGLTSNCNIVDDPNMPIPRVTSWGPQRGYKGGEITFSGTNFVPDKFCVKYGSVYLDIVSSATNQIVARLPATRQTGRLAVSHSTVESEYELTGDYYVAGDPVITGITPETFITGDIITVFGSDLVPFMFPRLRTDSVMSVVKIASNSTSDAPGDNRFLEVTEYHEVYPANTDYINEEGTQARFKVMGPLSISNNEGLCRYFVSSDPLPPSLTGNIRFVGNDVSTLKWEDNKLCKSLYDSSSWFTFPGPPVTWNQSGLSLTSFSGPRRWGDTDTNFIIAGEDTYSNIINLYGTDMWGASVKVGGADVLPVFNVDGRAGAPRIPMATPSGIIELTKDGQTVRSAEPLIVIPEPDVMKPSNVTESWGLPLDQEIDLAGWDLLPGNAVPGLNYTFNIPGANVTGCTQVQFVSHSNSHIKFRINSIGDNLEFCRSLTTIFGGDATRRLMTIVATYNGVERRLWEQSYYLVAP